MARASYVWNGPSPELLKSGWTLPDPAPPVESASGYPRVGHETVQHPTLPASVPPFLKVIREREDEKTRRRAEKRCWGKLWSPIFEQRQEENYCLFCHLLLLLRIPSQMLPLGLQKQMFSSQTLLHLRPPTPLPFSPESSFMMESAISATKVFEQHSFFNIICSYTISFSFSSFFFPCKIPNRYLPCCGVLGC